MWLYKSSILAIGALTLVGPASAQFRVYDKIEVDLPENTWIGGEKLSAGKYEIRQLPSPGDASNILLVNEKTDRRFTASAISQRALRNIPHQQTEVILQRVGEDYYLDQIWIAGREFGYRFELPLEARERIKELEQPLTLTATFSTPAPVAVAQATPPPPPPKPAPPPPQAQPAPPPPPEQPVQAQPAPLPVQERPAPPPPPAPPQELPKTASDAWLALAIGVSALAIGLVLRLVRRARA